ncbi:hypothetical protein DMH27_08930 [Raoultella planticola]|nr:hypothetical protein [Raoultella planticola]
MIQQSGELMVLTVDIADEDSMPLRQARMQHMNTFSRNRDVDDISFNGRPGGISPGVELPRHDMKWPGMAG